MKLALFDDRRLGAVTADGIVDVTEALPWPHDADPLTAGWWRRLCRDFDAVRPGLEEAAARGTARPAEGVRLLAPALNPSKIVACASNYAAHVEEMHGVQERTLGGVESWMMNFDVFLKAPSSMSGPREDIVLPPAEVEAGHEIHHESELVVVVGKGGKDIPEREALAHVFGYTIGLDITVRSTGDRSRRKSYDTFSPVGPWITTSDEASDPGGFQIDLVVNGDDHRQHVTTKEMITPVPAVVSYASRMMTLLPGDLIFTGAPPGVGPIRHGDVLDTRISGIGEMRVSVV
ncbi:fumarylacetoacetate hydrolase family protein [Actinoallomurus bryophytorum]|uniref:2-keto-4-pentenoate hydratase/2-oxohepta-3-ene-1,7-dioic acid hydratase in catechol pathway n=1 Tax=Actinoallomurus bryophytorum TaxID=1490222 RepID=A0A543CPY1_9ACTN|nr:fumarylacetoacetate hydrolase family protein [Actinoallomurus bryophytorum]TQL99168.1 2-keto-4-pentenoate hydratase/2-oxohepta-3-ene-1,7-dioic acid hydratase in catechol pathway [Actinoallomurus bryophytorum]